MKDRIFHAKQRFQSEQAKEISWLQLGREVYDLIGRTGNSDKWINRIKTGLQEPDVSESGALAYLLDVSPLWLCWEIGPVGRFPKDASSVEAETRLPPVEMIPTESPGATAKSAQTRPKKSGGRGR